MPIRLAILGLDPIQRDWLDAVGALCVSGEVELVGVAHQTVVAAKALVDVLKTGVAGATAERVSVFDDLRLMLKSSAPQVLLMDRPTNVTLDFLLSCVEQEIGILSLGPPVESLAEAHAMGEVLEAQSRLLYIWPRFADSAALKHCAQADDFVRPIRFASASWMGLNYAMAKTLASKGSTGGHGAHGLPDMPVRSMSVLAWDVLATLIGLMDVPTAVYGAIRGTMGSGNTFADLSGAASLTVRFPDDAAASVTLCDRAPSPVSDGGGQPWNRRDLLLWGGGGTVKLSAESYEFRDGEGQLIDAGPGSMARPASAATSAAETLREFLRHYALPPSPHRGWEHRLVETAATMEAFIVSHRTGQAESPERLRHLRR